MSSHKLQLNVSGLKKQNTNPCTPEHPSIRTDQLVEASFSSDYSPIYDTSNPQNSNSLRSIPSIHKLRELLSKTSEKLSSYTVKTENSNTYQDLVEKTKEIAELKKKIRVLELEKRELQNEFNKLADASMALREPVLDSDVASIKISKMSNLFIGKIKDNPLLYRNFLDVAGSENDFFLQLKSENFKFPLLTILQFTCEVLENRGIDAIKKEMFTPNTQRSFRSYSSMADDDYYKLIEESEMLAKTISFQKTKISEICEKVKISMNNGRGLASSLGRPHSSLIKSYSNSPKLSHNTIIEEKDEYKN